MTNLPKDDKKKKQDPAVTGQTLAGGGLSAGKERVDAGVGKQEVTPMTEYTRKVDLEPEVESWLEKLEKEDAALQQPVTDDKGQVVLDDVDDKKKNKFKVVLPLTKEDVDKGLHRKVLDSVRWLAEWCVRMMKMFSGKVAYRRK